MASSGIDASLPSVPLPSTGFLSSTQAQHWLWRSPAALGSIRSQAQRAAVQRIHRDQARAAGAAIKHAAAASAAAAVTTTPQSPAKAAEPTANDMMLSSPAPPAVPALVSAVATANVVAPSKKEKKDSGPIEPLTLAEEKQLRLHYTAQLTQMASILRLPTHVTHSAVIFFKRFYLRESVMEYSPKDVVYCCIYVACKAEEHHLPVDRMINMITNHKTGGPTEVAPAVPGAPRPAASAADSAAVTTVLSLEVPVLTHLKFHLRLYHLSRALRGLLKELETLDSPACARALYINNDEPALTQKLGSAQPGPGTSLQSVSSFFSGPRSASLSQLALFSDDLIFLHAPAQIALAIYMKLQEEVKQFGVAADLDTSANSGTVGTSPASAATSNAVALRNLDVVDRFVAAKALQVPPTPGSTAIQRVREQAASLSSMQSRISEIVSMLDDARALQTADSNPVLLDQKRKTLKAIEKKRKQCSNPLLDPQSKL